MEWAVLAGMVSVVVALFMALRRSEAKRRGLLRLNSQHVGTINSLKKKLWVLSLGPRAAAEAFDEAVDKD